MEKRGISTIVASVLVVLITVAAATLLWTMIIPMISKSAFIEDPNLRFEIDTKTSYTVYDNENGFLNIRIKRGADTSEVTALKFIIGVEGSSISRRISNEEVVLPNTAKIYQFAIGFYNKIDQVKVAPIFLYKGEEIEGRMYALEQRIPVKPNALDGQVGDCDIQGVEVSEGLVLYYSFDEEPRVIGMYWFSVKWKMRALLLAGWWYVIRVSVYWGTTTVASGWYGFLSSGSIFDGNAETVSQIACSVA